MKNFIYKYRYLIIIILFIIIILAFIIYKLKNKKGSKKETKIMEQGNNIENVGNFIYSYPKTKLSSYSLVIVFGGINYANPKWMLEQTPKDLISKAIFVFVPYTIPYTEAKNKIDSYLNAKSINTDSVSILGFSAGGLNVQRANLKDFKFIGLIDPSTRSEYVNLPFSENSAMVFNDSNWGGYPKIKEVLPKLAQSVKNAGGDSEKVSLSHAKIPAYFFNKYKNLIV